jgi:hypothetical protein
MEILMNCSRRFRPIATALAVALGMSTAPALAQSPDASFFLTSAGPGNGADLGGLAGADAHCARLAEAARITGKTWRAYLSTTGANGESPVDARDRIGSGPWSNVRGIVIARDVTDLHGATNNLTKQTVLDEQGREITGRGDSPNRHDILTGSIADGTGYGAGDDTTCEDWTSSAADGSARVGHFDRVGGGDDGTSWNSAHASRGCGQDDLRGTGGDGLFYCFAVTGG